MHCLPQRQPLHRCQRATARAGRFHGRARDTQPRRPFGYTDVPHHAIEGAWQHAPYFHDGSAATLEDVGATYNARRNLGLTPSDIKDLAQYLKSL